MSNAMELVLNASDLVAKFNDKTARVGVIGLGYVGLPLAMEFSRAGFHVVGFDIDPHKTEKLNAGESYIGHIPSEKLKPMLRGGKFTATADFSLLSQVDGVIICVPTPLTANREPDLSYIIKTGEAIQPHLRAGQLVSLESTTYPGTTEEVLGPILERGGLKQGRDFFLAYSPEREDPGNPNFSTSRIPKVVGGCGAEALRAAEAMYAQVVVKTVPVSSCGAAEAVKLTENIFRCVNIALVNELKVIYSRMGIDVWEVIEAAKTKPFGFMPFYPGPGLGGHCIPIDPFYLSWKARQYDCPTRFIELAGEINTSMPDYVVAATADALNDHQKSIKGSRVLILGMAYKSNVDDIRESPSLRLMQRLRAKGALVEFHDPYVPVIGHPREYPDLAGEESVPWDPDKLGDYDVVLISTAHDNIDYETLAKRARLIIDTRNAMNRVPGELPNVVKA